MKKDTYKSPNAAIWKDLGITEEGFQRCDAAMPHLLAAAEILMNEGLMERLSGEAIFQLQELPKRTADFNAKRKFRRVKP